MLRRRSCFPPPPAAEGCGDARTAYADVNGGDYRLTLSVVRILALLFLALGFVKARPRDSTFRCKQAISMHRSTPAQRVPQVLVALCGQCSRRASGRRGAGCASASISLIQGASRRTRVLTTCPARC